MIKCKFNRCALVILFGVALSCSNENNEDINSHDQSSIEILKKIDFSLFEKVNLNSYKAIEIFPDDSLEKGNGLDSVLEVDMYQVDVDGKKEGYYLYSDSFITFTLIDNSKNIIAVKNLSNNDMNYFEFIYNEDYGYDIIMPINNTNVANRCAGGLILCSTTCTLGTIGIAASDGPLPLMDIVAASFYVTCNAACALDYDNCLEQESNEQQES